MAAEKMIRSKFNKILSILSCIFFLLFLLALLNRTGSLVLFWKEEPLSSITHDAGYGYYAFVRDENISKLGLPFYLKEDDSLLVSKPLSVNEDITFSIKETGKGSFQIRENSDLYFSASDNHPEDHEYAILSPVIIRNRYLLPLAAAAFLFTAVILIHFIKARDIRPIRMIIRFLTAVCCLLMLLPWDKMTFPRGPLHAGHLMINPLLQRNIIFILLLLVLTALYFLLCENSNLLKCFSILIILINTVWYFLPEWNYYGLRADSPAYLESYTASSIRTPGYPVFIEIVYKITGSNGLSALRTEMQTISDESLQDGTAADSKGLLSVTRSQKIVLGFAFLLLAAVFFRYYAPIWFVFAAQIILSGGFLGIDNSYIMTECLSQAFCLIITAVFILFMKEKRAVFFVLLCVLSGIGMLIRPANIFLFIPIAVSALSWFINKHSILIPLIGCLAFLALTAIPAITIFRAYHVFVWMPTSGYVDIARAVEIMQPGDEDAFTDPEQREFCHDLLAKKESIGEADQNTYMWDVGIAAALERGYDLISCSPLLGKVSRKIFLLHPGEFVSAIAGTIRTALERTRLQIAGIPFPVIALLFIILFLVNNNTDSLSGLSISLMHIAHLFIFSMNQPERRYIFSTEILCLTGWLLIFISLMTAIKQRRIPSG